MCIFSFSYLFAENEKESSDISISNFVFDESLKQLLRSRWQYKTLSVSYMVEGSIDEGKTWELWGHHFLNWDIKNKKYYTSVLPAEKSKDGFVETREFYGEDGKWMVILGKVLAGGHGKIADKKITDVSICEEMEIPFYYPVCFWYLDKHPLDLFDKNLIFERESPGIISVATRRPSNPGHLSQTVFYFQEKTGLFLKQTYRVIDEKGKVVKIKYEISVPDGKYFSQNGLFFSEQIIIKNFDSNGKCNELIRSTFSDLEINKKISAEAFKPRLPLGTRVIDGFANDTYIVTEKSENAQEGVIVKKLNELFGKNNQGE